MARDLPGFARAVAVAAAPASGSAVAYALALAAALAQKVAERSPEIAPEVAVRAAELRQEALRLVDADERAVEEMLARRSPTPDAIAVPRRIDAVAAEIVDLAEVLARDGGVWLHADAVGARELARAARHTVAAILESNGAG